jgi:hypothetical protein
MGQPKDNHDPEQNTVADRITKQRKPAQHHERANQPARGADKRADNHDYV